LVFPIHPRTRKNADQCGILSKLDQPKKLLMLDPLNYVRFMNLVFNCRFALTDSGGIQEETTYLGIPCITLRPNTERPITVSQGSNRLGNIDNLEKAVDGVLAEAVRQECQIPLWDGKTAGRVVESIKNYFF
jgi:UDP-N-acetylglucosamine 2-epimerase (non-hydrolysing)